MFNRLRRDRSLGLNATTMPEEVLAYILAHRHSQSVMWLCASACMANAEDTHPYHVTPLKTLLIHDNEWEFDWCNWAINMFENDSVFLSNILWADEASFQRA